MHADESVYVPMCVCVCVCTANARLSRRSEWNGIIFEFSFVIALLHAAVTRGHVWRAELNF